MTTADKYLTSSAVRFMAPRWFALTDQHIPFDQAERMLDKIIEFYTESWREYHRFDHPARLIRLQEELFPDASDGLKYAIWFHDVFYLPGCKTNEAISAQIMDTMLAPYYSWEFVRWVERIINVTKEHIATGVEERNMEGKLCYTAGVYDNPDCQRMCDLDLYGLGDAPADYDESTAAVRFEFAGATEEKWAAGRRAFLTAYVARRPLYYTPECQDRAEPALANMGRELGALP